MLVWAKCERLWEENYEGGTRNEACAVGKEASDRAGSTSSAARSSVTIPTLGDFRSGTNEYMWNRRTVVPTPPDWAPARPTAADSLCAGLRESRRQTRDAYRCKVRIDKPLPILLRQREPKLSPGDLPSLRHQACPPINEVE